MDEHPIKDADLCDTRHQGSDHLNLEKEFRGDLHVVAQFQIGRKFNALCGADVAVCDEDHVCDRSAGEDDATDQLTDKIETAVLVGYCHHDADWNEEKSGYREGKQESVPWEVDRVVFDNKYADCEHDHKCSKIPRYRGIIILAHKAIMNIFTGHACD